MQHDLEAWTACEKHYFPTDYAPLWGHIDKHLKDHGELPTFESISLEVRDQKLRNRFFAIKSVEDVDIPCLQLVEYLKNEYTQAEIMGELEKYLNETIMMESAKENIEALQDIVLRVESKVNIKDPEEDMSKMNLFRPKEELDRIIPLGINRDFDRTDKFGPGSYILFGGKRGSGKSLTCSNIAHTVYEGGASVIYFTIEMSAREIIQRQCAIATGISANRVAERNLSIHEGEQVAQWWSKRFEEGEKSYIRYRDHHDFDRFHTELTAQPLNNIQLDVVYNSALTLSNIRMELDKKMSIIKPKAIIVDYINQVKRSTNTRGNQFDWTEQVEISKELKTIAQDYGVLVVSAYQIDNTGEARFAKGILDSPNGSWTLHPLKHPHDLIEFKCTKRRDGPERDFVSKMDWDSLKIGPEVAELPREEDDEEDEDDVMRGQLRSPWGQ